MGLGDSNYWGELANLEKLEKQPFLFFEFPAKMGGLESFPIRAVAIEEKD